ncbi:hypothetical protein NMG60_11033521 [Bertholletia excelsa]
MSKSLKEAFLLHCNLTRSYSLSVCTSRIAQSTALKSIYDTECILNYSFGNVRYLDFYHKWCMRPFVQHFSAGTKMESICWGESSQSVLVRKLEVALKDHNLDEAWETYKDFRNLYGFPDHSLMSRLIIELSYSSDSHWLQRACDLVLNVQGVKSDLLCPSLLIKLSLSLARAQMPVLASRIFRLMIEKQSLPTVNILGLFFLHMVKTQIGMFLASNILIELCHYFQDLNTNRSTSSKPIKPDTMVFNLVLDACVRFGSSFKGHQIVELMAQVGVVADAHTIVIISRIHEINGQRDELKKFRDYIDRVMHLVPLVHHYRQFYDSLLSLHFKYDDVDSASGLILDMAGLKIQILPELLPDSVLKVENKEDLISYKNDKLVLNNKGIARLVIQYKRCGRISDLSRILVDIQKNGSLKEENLSPAVIEACISLGWLEIAHDIVDDMELAGSPLDTSSYMSLLRAYNERNMFREAEALLRQIRKAGLSVKIYDDTMKGTTSSGKSDLAESFIRELGQEKSVPSVVYELNSSIYFFWKAKMVRDALETYRKMQEMNIKPTLQTYIYMVSGYSSLGMHREITILWGDIKRSMEDGILTGDRDLFEFIMLNFLRGGYFERVMEVISYMKKNGMYVDKWIFRTEFLKLHKDLYRCLKAGSAKTEAQSKRIEYVRAFRKWIDIS